MIAALNHYWKGYMAWVWGQTLVLPIEGKHVILCFFLYINCGCLCVYRFVFFCVGFRVTRHASLIDQRQIKVLKKKHKSSCKKGQVCGAWKGRMREGEIVICGLLSSEGGEEKLARLSGHLH